MLVVYLLTMAPRLTWASQLEQAHIGRDGGDFISAAWFLGVPHPTGYPTYTLLAWLFTRLPLGNVAWRVHLLSGLAGAGAVTLLYLIGRRRGARSEGRGARRSKQIVEAEKSGPLAWGAGFGALLFGLAPLVWGHSIIAEVHALHLFTMALVLGLMLRWRDGHGSLSLAALVFGLGMGNHVTLAFTALPILALLWSGRERLARRSVLLAALALLAGLLVYAYPPWRAARDPIINWGDPDDKQGFWWLVSGQGYRHFFFALPNSELLPRLGNWWAISRDQFPLPVWPVALLGLWGLARRQRWLALGTCAHAAISLVYSLGYNTTDAFVYLLPAYFYVALWAGWGVALLLEQVRDWGEPDPRVSGILAAGLLLVPLLLATQRWSRMDLTHDRQVEAYAQETLEVVEPGALILVSSDAYTFALWYYHYVEGLRPDVLVINKPMLSFEWYRHTVSVHHPELVLPGPSTVQTRKLNTVLSNIDQRAVYIAEDEDDLDGMVLTPVGRLWRVTKP